MEALPITDNTQNNNPEKEDKEGIVVSPGSKINTYAAKKSVAQRMMDIALLTSNANQLRYILRFGKESSTYHLAVWLVVISIVFQILVGLFLIFVPKKNESPEARDRANNIVIAGVFLITIVNVLTSAFAVEDSATPAVQAIAPVFNNISGSG